jgi:TRAP transporter TAXI family solute receptor
MKLRAVSLLLVLFASLFGAAYAAMPVGMTTGPKTGTYIVFGHDIAAVAAKEGLTINVYDSNGSIENIKRLTSKEKVGLAIVQSDVLGFLSHSKNGDSLAAAKQLRLIAPFYNEEVHVLARKDITKLSDLAGKRVVVGSEGSGSMITAVNIFSIMGVTPSKMYEIDAPRGVVAVLNNDADAMVFVGGKPVKMFKNMEELATIKDGGNAGKLDQVHFLALDDPRLLKEYKTASITHNDYGYVGSDIPTIAVTAVLISHDYTLKKDTYYHEQCHNMAKLAHILRDHLDDLKAHGHPKWKEVDLNSDVGIWKRDSCSQASFGEAASAQTDGDNRALEKDLIGIIRGKSQ